MFDFVDPRSASSNLLRPALGIRLGFARRTRRSVAFGCAEPEGVPIEAEGTHPVVAHPARPNGLLRSARYVSPTAREGELHAGQLTPGTFVEIVGSTQLVGIFNPVCDNPAVKDRIFGKARRHLPFARRHSWHRHFRFLTNEGRKDALSHLF